MADDNEVEGEEQSADVIHLFEPEEHEKDPDQDLLIEMLKAMRTMDQNMQRLAQGTEAGFKTLSKLLGNANRRHAQGLRAIKDAIVHMAATPAAGRAVRVTPAAAPATTTAVPTSRSSGTLESSAISRALPVNTRCSRLLPDSQGFFHSPSVVLFRPDDTCDVLEVSQLGGQRITEQS